MHVKFFSPENVRARILAKPNKATVCKRMKGEEKRKGKLSGTSSSKMRSAILFSVAYIHLDR